MLPCWKMGCLVSFVSDFSQSISPHRMSRWAAALQNSIYLNLSGVCLHKTSSFSFGGQS